MPFTLLGMVPRLHLLLGPDIYNDRQGKALSEGREHVVQFLVERRCNGTGSAWKVDTGGDA